MMKKLLLAILLTSNFLIAQTIYVDQNATGLNNGIDWENSYTDLQTAITNIGTNTTVNVAKGTYYPTANTDRSIYFSIPRDKKLLGGFPTGGGTRDSEQNPTILSGDIGVIDDNTDNSYHVVVFGGTSYNTEIDGFIIEKANANGSGANEGNGGGIFISTVDSGDSNAYIRNCTIRNNYANGSGGGIFVSKRAEIYNCKIYSNQAGNSGGGIYINTNGRIYNSYILNNKSTTLGGGIYITGFNSAPKAINCVIVNNEATNGAGAYLTEGKLNNCTIVNNGNGAFFGTYGGSYNSIIWGNSSYQINKTSGTNNLIQDFVSSGTNIGISSANNGTVFGKNYPRFTTPTTFTGNATTPAQLDEILNADWSINPQSAAINFGDNSSYPTTTDTPIVDIIGNNRTINTTMDAGAHEALTNVITNIASNQLTTSADLNGEVLFAETTNTIERGFVYATTPNFDVTTATSVTNSGTGSGVFTNNITSLTENIFYYYKSWVLFDGTKYYGNEVQFNTSNLIAYYPFNGNANDESGNDLNGTVSGATLSTDRFNNTESAYSFDGNDIITISHNDILNCSNELSISVWVKPNSLQNAMILGKSNYSTNTNYLLRTKSTGYIAFEYKDFANSNSLPLKPNIWNHIAVISQIDNSKMVYINGVLVTHTSASSPFGVVNNALTIGARSGAEFFNGSIDDLRIYKSALTETEILSLFTNNTLKIEKVEDVTESNFYVFENILHFKNTQNSTEIKSVEIYNLLGQKVFETTEIHRQISFETLKNGMYILKVENNDEKFSTLKFLINK